MNSNKNLPRSFYTVSNEQTNQPSPQNNKNNTVYYILSGVVVLLGAAFVIFLMMKDGKKEIVQQTESPVQKEVSSTSGSKTSTEQIDELAVKSVVDTWLMCWEKRDIDCYKSYITDDYIFAPAGKLTQNYYTRLNTLAEYFRRRTYIYITHDKFDVEISENNAVVSYFQRYNSNEYNDAGNKKVYLRKANDKWLIYKDTFTPSN